MSESLGAVFANVLDVEYGAVADNSAVDSTEFIQLAIDSKRNVLFPKGIYYLYGSASLNFHNDDQRFLFLAGATLRLQDATNTTNITITGKRQTFVGLNIVTASVDHKPNPCLQIEGADGLLLKDVHVQCDGGTTLVRVRDTVGITFEGGEISGINQDSVSIGLDLGSGVKELSARALTIHQLGYGVVLEDTTESISFVDCNIENQMESMIDVRGRVTGLNVVGVHMEANSAANRFVVVQRGGAVDGGVFTGCEFGELGPVFVNDKGVMQGRRVFVIGGEWIGVNVSGCWHNGAHNVSADRHAVWEIQHSATVSRSCDIFNMWDLDEVVTGPKAALLPLLFSDGNLGPVMRAGGVRLNASKIGFFGASPVVRAEKYQVRHDFSHHLPFGSAYAVLGALLRDLAALGLIECDVIRSGRR